MSATLEAITRIEGRIRNARSVSGYAHALEELANLGPLLLEVDEQDRATAYEQWFLLCLMSVRAAREALIAAPARACGFLIAHVLPAYLSVQNVDTKDSRGRDTTLRQSIAEWIDSYDHDQPEDPRSAIYAYLRLGLQSAQASPCFRMVGAIGYRANWLEDYLRQLVASRGQYYDEALRAFSNLGPDGDDRRLLQDEAETLLSQGSTTTKFVLWHLASRQHLPRLMEIAKTEKDALWRLGSIARQYSTDESLQDQLAQFLSDLATDVETQRFLGFAGGVFDTLDSPIVIPTILRWISASSPGTVGVGDRWRWYTVVERCTKPRQHSSVGMPKTVMPQRMQEDLHLDSGPVDRTLTFNGRCKESAWLAALMLFPSEALGMLQNIVASEQNPFLQAELLRTAACFQCDLLPHTVQAILTESGDVPRGSMDGKLIVRLSAVRFARSAASMSAFESLCNCVLTVDGHLLLAPVDALGDVSSELYRNGHHEVIDRLVTLLRDDNTDKRAIAIGAIERVARQQSIESASLTAELTSLLNDDAQPPYLLEDVIGTIGHLSALPAEVLAKLMLIAAGPDAALSWTALRVIVHHDEWTQIRVELLNRLGLQETDGRIDVNSPTKYTADQASVLAMLWSRDPLSYNKAMSGVLAYAPFEAAAQLYRRLMGGKQSESNKAIASALILRVRGTHHGAIAEPWVFELLQRIAPSHLTEFTLDECRQWLPDARVALADALGRASLREEEKISAGDVLVGLMGDGRFAVRRASYRALNRLAPQDLKRMIESWSRGELVALRRRAAEALGQLSCDVGDEDFQAMSQCLKCDREPSVRSSAYAAINERDERRIADGHLAQVLRAAESGDANLRCAFAASVALRRVGQDVHVARLREYVEANAVRPHIRYWIGNLVERIERRWSDVTNKWPEAWQAWHGTIEEVDGRVVVGGKTTPVHLSLWRLPSEVPRGVGSWGGLCCARSQSTGLLWPQAEPFEIQIEGRRSASAIAVTIHIGSTVVFRGDGAYPVAVTTSV